MTMPLYDLNAEKSVLGSMIIDKEACLIATRSMVSGDFYDYKNNLIYESIEELTVSEEPVDIVTLKSKLESKGKFDEVGGIRYIADLANGVPTSAHVKKYIKILKELAFRRQCLLNAEQIKARVYDSDYTELVKTVSEIADVKMKTDEIEALPKIVKQALLDVSEHIKSKKKLTGISTGFTDLDMTLGGLQDTDYIVIAARPSMGKTAFSLDILRKAAKELKTKNKIAVFFSLEMSAKKLGMRLLSSEMGIENEKFKFGTLTQKDLEILKKESTEFEKMIEDIYIDDNSSVTVQDMYSKCYTQKCNTEKEIGLILIDYIQLIMSESKNNNRNNELSEISRDIKKIAKDFNCPVVVLAQLNRAVDMRADKRPILSDLRDSGAIEQDADVVLMLHREEYYNPTVENKGKAEVIVAKHREGEIGRIELIFLDKFSSFRSAVR